MIGESRVARQLTLRDSSGSIIDSRRASFLEDEASLVAVALALGARGVSGWSDAEDALARDLPVVPRHVVSDCREQILAGDDPLGDAFCRIRLPAQRREQGATFTPRSIVDAMIDWAAGLKPDRVVDPGTGSGRYLLVAGIRFPAAQLIGIELDPLPAMLARANLAAVGFAERARVIIGDYRSIDVPKIQGRTLFVGNPPYVRHHKLDARWKRWLIDESMKRGYAASQLAGLHVHFFLATVLKAARGDCGAFITAAEWLDVNYGSLVRDLFLRDLGGKQIVVIEPTAVPFPDAATTAAVTYFKIGSKPRTICLKRIRRLDQLSGHGGNRKVRRERLEAEQRWSRLTRRGRKVPNGFIELGELCRVHRGQVTGLNKVWIAGPHSGALPESVMFPSVTKARELFTAGRVLRDPSALRKVIDLPIDLDTFGAADRRQIDRFLSSAKSRGAHLGYVAQNRRAWWAVGLREPAPILTTYMARRPPAFVRNRAQARHINIAHGIYPRQSLSDAVLTKLVEYLCQSVTLREGRTYSGGLTKFEPREVERLFVPGLDMLAQGPDVP